MEKEKQWQNIINSVSQKITSLINEDNIENIIQNNIVKAHLENKAMMRFHEYYFKVLQNKEYFLQTKNVFQEFGNKYGIKNFPKELYSQFDENKIDILPNIEYGNFDGLYDVYRDFIISFHNFEFYSEKKHDILSIKSFYTKLVHTFIPKNYSMLDNNIICYFNTDSVDFFEAFACISRVYELWSEKNQDIIQRFREAIEKHDTKKVFPKDKITDLKILDMIFWVEAKKKYNY